MVRRLTRTVAAVVLLLVFSATAVAEVVPFTPSSVYNVTLAKFYNGESDLLVTIYVRDGKPVHGYAVAGDNRAVIHRIDLTPAAPIEYIENGKRFMPGDSLKGNYDYKKPEFREYRNRYNAKKIEMRNYDAPVAVQADDKRIAGTFDLFLDVPDRKKRVSFRIAVDLPAAAGGYAGKFTAYDYHPQDETFGVRVERFEGQATAVLNKAAWEQSPERAFAAGKDWPQTHGPTLTGSAIDCERELIDNLADARLMWVADLPIPGGRQGIPRSEFGFFPINNSGLGITQFSAPIVAKGKVYLALPYPDEAALAATPGVAAHPQVIRGADPRVLAADLGLLRDTLFCFDAQTGRVLWAFRDERKGGLAGESKSGRGLTAVYSGGKIIFRGQSSMYGVDAETGKLLWQNKGESKGKDHPDNYGFGATDGLSTDDSPVVIGDVVIARINDTPKPAKSSPLDLPRGTSLVGLDPATGRALWRVRHVSGSKATPTAITLGGKPYVLAAYEGAERIAEIPEGQIKPEHRGMLTLIEPTSGKIVWQKPVAGPTQSYPVVWNDVVMLNVNRDQMGKDKKQKPIVTPWPGGVRVGMDDVKPLWSLPKLDWQDGRQTPVAHNGVFLIDSRITGFQAIKADTGEVVGKFPHIYHMSRGDHNWTWVIASNNRVITSGEQMLLFKLVDNELKLMPGGLPADLAGGYVCPIRPALADGRLVVRTSNGLACFDLRKPVQKQAVDSMQLRTADLALGMRAGEATADMQIRMVDGKAQTMMLRYPAYQNISTPRPFAWGGVDTLRWRVVGASGLMSASDRLHGTVWMRVNEHSEPWLFDLAVKGEAISGTCQRTIPAAPRQVKVAGQIDGEQTVLDDKRSRYTLRLVKGGINGEEGPADFTLVIDKLPDGQLLACGASARMNQAMFEVDCSAVKVDGEHVRGALTVIFHSDRFKHLRSDLGSALAGVYQLDVKAAKQEDGKTTVAGSFTGVVGVSYERKVAVSGSLKRGQEVQVEVDKKGTVAMPSPPENEE